MIFGLLSALLGTAGAHAQMIRVRGRVTDSNGEPLAFVSVVFPGTTVGITTDEQGFYSLETRDPVIRNRARNDPDRHDTYHCRTYTKMELDLTNIRPGFRNRRMQRNFGFIFNYMDTSALTGQAYLPAMISESTADLYRSRSPEVQTQGDPRQPRLGRRQLHRALQRPLRQPAFGQRPQHRIRDRRAPHGDKKFPVGVFSRPSFRIFALRKRTAIMKKAALFDMDGTLVDNTLAHVRAFEVFCARYGVEGWQQRLSQAYGMGNDDIMRLILPEELIRQKGVKALGDEKEAIYREIYAPEIHPVEGLRQLLERLNGAGIRCAVGSSGCRANVDFVLEKCRIGQWFEARISGDAVTHCKPDPEIYLKAAAAVGCDPADCVVFEDAKAGIESARRAGAGRIVALATTLPREVLERETSADLVIDTFADLTDLDALLA